MFMYDGISKLGSAVLIVRLRWFSIIELERSRTLLWRRCVVNEGGLESLTGACSRVKNCRLKAETDSRVWRGSEGHVCSLLARHAFSLPPSPSLSMCPCISRVFPHDAFLAARKLTREYFIFKGSAPEDRVSLQEGKRNTLTGRKGCWEKEIRANERFATLFATSSLSSSSLSLSPRYLISFRLRFVIMNFVDDVINVD